MSFYRLLLVSVVITACSSPRSLCYQEADANDMCSVAVLFSSRQELADAGLLLCLESIQERQKCREQTALPIVPWAP